MANDLLDIADAINTVRHLVEAVWMAASALPMSNRRRYMPYSTSRPRSSTRCRLGSPPIARDAERRRPPMSDALMQRDEFPVIS